MIQYGQFVVVERRLHEVEHNVFFYWQNLLEGNFFCLWPIFGKNWTQKNIVVAKNSSIISAFNFNNNVPSINGE